MEIRCAVNRSSLTAQEAIALAEQALKAGRIQAAACYVNVAYAIFDANIRVGAAVTSPRPD